MNLLINNKFLLTITLISILLVGLNGNNQFITTEVNNEVSNAEISHNSVNQIYKSEFEQKYSKNSLNDIETNTEFEILASDLIVEGTQNLDLSDGNFNNVFVFDNAKLVLRNSTIQGVLQVTGNAEVQILSGSSISDAVFSDNNAILTIDSPSSMANVNARGQSTVTITNAEYFSIQLTEQAFGQLSNVNYLQDAFVGSHASLTLNDVTLAYWLEIYQGTLTATNLNPAFDYDSWTPEIYSHNATVSITNAKVQYMSLYQMQSVHLDNVTIGNHLYIDNSIVDLSGLTVEQSLTIRYSTVTMTAGTIGGSINLRQYSSLVLNSVNVHGNIYPEYYDYDSMTTPNTNLTLINTDAIISSHPSNTDANRKYGIQTVVMDGSNSTAINLNIENLELVNSAQLNKLGTSIHNLLPGDSTGIIVEVTTIKIGSVYYIGGSDVIYLENESFTQIILFGSSQLNATNVDISDILLIIENASAIFNGGSFSGIINLDNNAILTIDGPSSMANVNARGQSTVTITNAEYFSIQLTEQAFGQLSNVNYLQDAFVGSHASLTLNDVTLAYWLEIYQGTLTATNLNPAFDYDSWAPEIYSHNATVSITNAKVQYMSLYQMQSVHLDNVTIGNHLYIDNSIVDLSGLTVEQSLTIRYSTVTMTAGTIGGSINLRQYSSLVLNSVNVHGNIYPEYYDYDSMTTPNTNLTLINTDAIISSHPSNTDANRKYGIQTLVVDGSNSTAINLNIENLELVNSAQLNKLGTSIHNLLPGDSTGIIVEVTTIKIGSVYYIGGSDVIYLENESFTQIILFGSSQLNATNVDISDILLIIENASAIFNGGSFSGIINLDNNAILTIDSPSSMANVNARGQSTVTITNAEYFSIQLTEQAFGQLSNVNYLQDAFVGSHASLTLNDVTLAYWLEIYQGTLTATNLNPAFDYDSWAPEIYSHNATVSITNAKVQYMSLYQMQSVHLDNVTIGNHLYIDNSIVDLSGLTVEQSLTIRYSTVTMTAGTIGGSINLRQYSSLVLNSVNVHGNIYPEYYDYDSMTTPNTNLTLINTDAIISSHPSNTDANRKYGIQTLVVDGSTVTIFNIYIVNLYAKNHSTIKNQNSIIENEEFDSTSGYEDVIIPLSITIKMQNGVTVPGGYPIPYSVAGTNISLYFKWNDDEFIQHQIGVEITTPMEDGEHTLTIKIIDSNENEKTATLTVIVSNDGISIILKGPSQQSRLYGSHPVEIEFGSIPNEILYNWNNNTNSSISPQQLITISDMPVNIGIHVLHIWVSNEFNIWSYSMFMWEIFVNNPPNLTILYPTEGDTVSEKMTISWDSTDPDGDPLSFTLEYQALDSAWETIVSDHSGKSYEWDIAHLAEGEYKLKIIASDGWDSVFKTVSFIVSKTPQTNPLPPNPLNTNSTISFLLFISLIKLTIGFKRRVLNY
jgi:hypothetical protein